ncbi:ABC transporter ATP-binding protein [Aureimonas fodinaquatilis]|uniref:ABC transporter ATP-binding protein n=1 Tax=Aureimonas fodinaquatilis TaxID=2565783 RepID=A0A5B0DVV8_9HYPH|nr:ABC transporter ATP-binding protein [Aureimonas fodinaquatilis]KAA0970626.1 ABC transporter ATP-binding protein [Aureimonas fodinaquatilis]
MLELINVSKNVGRQAHISNATLKLARGSLNVLLGPTLSGKTSLMRLMAGLDKPETGQIRMDGQDVTGVSVRHRGVAMVYQQFINYPSMTVFENIASPLRLAGVGQADIDQRVGEAARLLRLEPYLQRLPANLSGGQQQRTALARALVKRAGLVLLDEPLANLDYKLREELREELPRIFAQSAAVLVYATTEPAEALLLGGNTGTLSEGRITQFGPTAEVYRNPELLITARTFSDPPLNVLAFNKHGPNFVSQNGLLLPVARHFSHIADGPYQLAIRPHHLSIVPLSGHSVSLAGNVVVSEMTGSESFLHVQISDGRIIALVRGVERHAPGDAIRLYVDPEKVLVFGVDGSATGRFLSRAA